MLLQVQRLLIRKSPCSGAEVDDSVLLQLLAVSNGGSSSSFSRDSGCSLLIKQFHKAKLKDRDADNRAVLKSHTFLVLL